MIPVRKHIRKIKNGVSVIRKHQRGKYGAKPLHDKYAPRDNSSMDMETLQKHYAKYQAEFTKLLSGEWTSSAQHRAFIARRLRNVKMAIAKKKKVSNKQN